MTEVDKASVELLMATDVLDLHQKAATSKRYAKQK